MKHRYLSETLEIEMTNTNATPPPPSLYNPDKGKTQLDYEHFLAYSGLYPGTEELRYAYFHGADVGLDKPEKPIKTQSPITNEVLDKHIDAVLRATGSSLKNYSMESTKNNMRAAMLGAMIEAMEILP